MPDEPSRSGNLREASELLRADALRIHGEVDRKQRRFFGRLWRRPFDGNLAAEAYRREHLADVLKMYADQYQRERR